jgi:Holliday junction resolvase RusA-like endonuclease
MGEGHWSAVHKAKKEWTEYLSWFALRDRVPKAKPGDKFRIDVVFFRPGPAGDKDNDYANCKVIIDAMKRAGLIVDDSRWHIDLEVCSVSASRSRTRVTRTRIEATRYELSR